MVSTHPNHFSPLVGHVLFVLPLQAHHFVPFFLPKRKEIVRDLGSCLMLHLALELGSLPPLLLVAVTTERTP